MGAPSRPSMYLDKMIPAKEALSRVRNGKTIFVGSGAGEPRLLVNTLAEMANKYWDVQVIHLAATDKEFVLARPEYKNHFHYNTFYIGQGVSVLLSDGTADYTPMNISEIPMAMERGILDIDVALIQVSPPDSLGLCSLGVSVGVTKAAAKHAKTVIAQINENMPVTFGDSLIPIESIDYLVEGNTPIIEVEPPEVDPITLTIGRYIANLIKDGMTLSFDRGAISASVMRYLDTKKDLGIHTDFLTDDIMRLVKSRAVTNRRKKINKGKTVATMAVGTKSLYEWLHENPYIEILPIDHVNDPYVIGQNDDMVSIHSVYEVELTGVSRAFSEKDYQLGGLAAGRDFMAGARRSKNGFTIVALPSTTADGNRSRIVSLSSGHGAYFSRSQVDFVVTEYGSAYLFGLSSRERAIALISIAHPKFRKQLLEEAKEAKYVNKDLYLPTGAGSIYPSQYEFTHICKDGTEIFFRPVKPNDARHIQELFYSLSPATRRLRYHGTIKILSNVEAQRMASIDYSQDVAIVGLVDYRTKPKIVAEGRYMYDPTNNMGEFDILVHEDYQGRGIGKFLGDYMKKIAFSQGLSGIYAKVIQRNEATIALLNQAWPTAEKTFDSGGCTFTLRFPAEDVKNPKDSIIVYSGRFGDFSYGGEHPFDPSRVVATFNLINEQNYLSEPWMRVEEPQLISKETLNESHDPEYIDALAKANSGQWDEQFLAYHLGGDECPIFPRIFDYILLYTSATITAVNLILEENANVVFNPLGGFHHSSRSHAEGFCYVNDAIVAIDMFLARGMRVAYIDIDAHHGNGVQDTYYADDRVLTVSLHQSGKTLYPWSGFENEIGEDIGKGYTLNIPLPEGTDDELYEMMFDQVVTPAVEKFQPSVVVAVIGADTHRNDPLAQLDLTNNGMVEAMKRIRNYSQHLLLLGAGGYNEESTTAAWCRMWAAANRIDALPDYLLTVGGTFMGSQGVGGGEIVDMPYRASGEKKAAMLEELERIVEFHEETTIPLIGKHT